MALDFSGLQSLSQYGSDQTSIPDSWWQDTSGQLGNGQGQWYNFDPNSGYQPLTQADIDAHVNQTGTQQNSIRQQNWDWMNAAGGLSLTPDQLAQVQANGPNSVAAPSGYKLGSSGSGSWEFAPQYDERFLPKPNHNDGFFQKDAYDPRAMLSEMPGLMIPLVALTAGAGAAAMGGAAAGGEAGGLGLSAGEGGALASGTGVTASGASTAGTGAGVTGGGSMWDIADGYDPGGEGVYTQPSNPDPYGIGTDQFGNPTNQFAPSTFSGDTSNTGFSYNTDPNYMQLAQKYGPQAAQRIYGLLKGGGPGGSSGGNILNTIGNDPGQALFNSLPFLYSIYEANRQGNQVNPILSRVSGLADSAADNQSGLVASAVGPYDRETMAGRDAAMTDQSLRGVRGSSFGDQAISNYDLTRARGRGELVGSTQAKSIGLQGGLLDSLLKGTTQAATSRNMLIGAGLSASGKLFQPQSDPFGLSNLLSLGAGGIDISKLLGTS